MILLAAALIYVLALATSFNFGRRERRIKRAAFQRGWKEGYVAAQLAPEAARRAFEETFRDV